MKEAFCAQNRIDLIYHYLNANQPLKAKLEPQNVKATSNVREKIICLSAKYRGMNFLCHLMAVFYQYGSNIKQIINRLVGFRQVFLSLLIY